MSDAQPLLKLQGIGKQFSGVSVLRDIDLKVSKGEIRAVLGANGAGKSTLMKIIGGVYKPDSGKLFLNGNAIKLDSPYEAQKNGISVIYQELSLVPTMDAVSNVFLGMEITGKAGFLDKKKMLTEYEILSDKLNFDIEPGIKVGRLSIAQQQMLEIMKALSRNPEIIIMDEPTTSLTESEKSNLHEVIMRLKEQGKTILYISHMLDEVFKISDSITILKDGEHAGTYPCEETDKNKVISIMTGKSDSVSNTAAIKNCSQSNGAPVLSAVNISKKNTLENISFDLYGGEILGIAGLVGSGRTELCRILFGDDKSYTGNILVNGEKNKIKNTNDAIRSGIGLIPEDRKNLGLIQLQEVYKNSTSIQLEKMLSGLLLNKSKEFKFTRNAVEKLGIKLSGVEAKARNLSGGNQQKVVVSKWLGMNLKVLIFDEPTKGIDVAAKEDIFRIIHSFAADGLGVIFISSDLEEVARISNRVLVMRKGRIVTELEDETVNIKDITYHVLNG